MKEFTEHQYAYGLISPLYGEIEVGVKKRKKKKQSFVEDPLGLFLSQVFILYIIVFAWLIGKSKKKWDIA